MRLFLDAHISARRVASALRDAGHEVRAADEERDLDGMNDEDLLRLAASEARIFVTFDVADFALLARRWDEAGLHHSGCVLVVGIDHREFGLIVRVIQQTLAARPEPDAWRDFTCFASRSSG